MIRHRLAVLSALALAVLAGFTASQAFAGDPTPTVPAPVERVEQFYAAGPSAEYGGDSGSIGSVDPLVWQIEGAVAQTAVIEASFQYKTVGTGPFVVTLGVREVGGTSVAGHPERLTLAPAPDGATTTTRFLVAGLQPGQSYKAFVGVNSVFGQGHNKVATRKMLVTVELSDAG